MGKQNKKITSLIEKERKLTDQINDITSKNLYLEAYSRQGWIQSSSSDFQKSLKCFETCVYFSVRFFLVAHEIKYPSYCSVYYEMKQRKKASNIAPPSFPQQSHSFPNEFDESPFACYRPLSRLPRTTRKNSWATRGQHLYAAGRTGWFMDLFTNHSKPSSIRQKHLHSLANYSNSVVIGYPGHKLPWKLLTIVYNEKPLPERPLVCSCSD